MRITADTNVLLRAVSGDDDNQRRAASVVLREAEMVAISTETLCEFVWVLRRSYKQSRATTAEPIRRFLKTGNVMMDRPAVEAGLRLLDAGGDFADGVIAHQGRRLGGEVFVSFDKEAVALLEQQGQQARLLT